MGGSELGATFLEAFIAAVIASVPTSPATAPNSSRFPAHESFIFFKGGLVVRVLHLFVMLAVA